MFDSINVKVDAAFDNVLDFVLGPVSDEPNAEADTELVKRRQEDWLRVAAGHLRYTILFLMTVALLRALSYGLFMGNMAPTQAMILSVYLLISALCIIRWPSRTFTIMKVTCVLTPARHRNTVSDRMRCIGTATARVLILARCSAIP